MERKYRKYLPTLGDLIDRLSIVQIKEVKISENKAAYSQEIDDLLHDINEILQEAPVTAELLRDIIIVAQYNLHIWQNESDVRGQMNGIALTDAHFIDIGKRLSLTHSVNGIRNTAKNRINAAFGGRLDLKIDCLAADAETWKPSKY